MPSSLEFWPQEVLVRHVNIFFWACAAHRNKKLGHKRSGAVIIFLGRMMPMVEKSLGDRNLSRRAIKKKVWVLKKEGDKKNLGAKKIWALKKEGDKKKSGR